MHIGLNLIFLVPDETGGMEIAARELIPALLDAAPEGTRFTAFINREAAARDGPWGKLLPAVTVPVNARNRAQWVLGEQALLPRLAARTGVDLLHSLASTAPAHGNFRRVVTVHDLIYARFPETHAGSRALGMRVLVPLAVRRSQRVICDSQNTADDVVKLLKADPSCIDVVPLGIGALKRCEPPLERELRERLGIDERPVLLSLSAKRPHKNLAALMGALARIDVQHRPQLVLPGYATAYERELRERARAMGVAPDVHFVHWLSEAELEGVWQLADAFVFPSLYEGFGLPILEAMARGVPVACSNASSLPEVAGDAALLFDPHDEQAIAAAVQRLLYDPAEARRLRAAGTLRAAQFSWQRTAQLTLASYARTFAS